MTFEVHPGRKRRNTFGLPIKWNSRDRMSASKMAGYHGPELQYSVVFRMERVAMSELSDRCLGRARFGRAGRRSSILAMIAIAGVAILVNAGTATAEPQGGVVVQQDSGSAVIDWRSFNIGTGESVNFNQPSATALTINRVLGGASIPSGRNIGPIGNAFHHRIHNSVLPTAKIDPSSFRTFQLLPTEITSSPAVRGAVNLRGVIDAQVFAKGERGGAVLFAPPGLK